jgi:2-alkenal reductase
VSGGSTFSVVLSDGTEVSAELIGEDPRDDLAVVKIDGGDVPAMVALGDSSQLKVGETVLAIGSPLRWFENTVTQGIVGSLNRNNFSRGGICQAYSDLIQHDAALNPGNSGGPLFNLRGEVVGVNTLSVSSTPDGLPIQGISFAIPSNTVATVVDQLINEGDISAPYLGITFADLTPELSAVNDLPVDYGVFVQDVVPDGPADEAGIEPGDIILSLGGEEISAEISLSSLLFDRAPGDTVDVTLLRGDDEETVSLTLGEVPESAFESCAEELEPSTP